MLGAIIGAAVGVGSSIFGGISASKAMNKYRNSLNKRKRENENWYNRRYNEDATQRADAQRILTKTDEAIRNRNRQAAGTQAVIGGTDESVAATKAANNQALAEATSMIAANSERRKDEIEAQYLQRKADLNNQLDGLEVSRANNTAAAVKGAGQAAGNIANIIDSYVDTGLQNPKEEDTQKASTDTGLPK